MAEAGLQLVHVSIYSVRPRRRGPPARHHGLDRARVRGGSTAAHAARHRGQHQLRDQHAQRRSPRRERPPTSIERHPYIRHFVWNNLDPSMGRAEVNQDQFTPRLADFELSLHRAMRLLAPQRPHLPRREGAALLHDRVRVGEHRDAQDRQGRGAHRALPRRQADRAPDRLGAPLRAEAASTARCARSAAASSIAATPTTPPSCTRCSSPPSRSSSAS